MYALYFLLFYPLVILFKHFHESFINFIRTNKICTYMYCMADTRVAVCLCIEYHPPRASQAVVGNRERGAQK